MANGLTACILEGKITNGRDFIFKCSRNEGALYRQANNFHFNDEPIYHEANLEHYDRKIKESKQDLEMYRTMSHEEAEKRIEEECAFHEGYNVRRNEETEATREKYTKILNEVEAWNPPEQLQHMKDFAIRNIKESIEWDCGKRKDVVFTRPTAEEWLAERVEMSENFIKMYEGNKEEHIKQVKEANEWIDLFLKELREWK